MANMIVYSAFTKPGDTIASLSLSSGAHISMAGAVPRKVFGLNVVELPFDQTNLTLKVEESIKIIEETKPKILVLGGSVILFPQPVKALVEVCKKVGTMVLFDAAHVAGLIAAGEYPNPFDDGVDIMTMTVCKTIPGPQHAFILSREELSEPIKRTTFPGFLSGHHLHETVASVLVMEEMKKFGNDYAKQVLVNVKTLAQSLSEYGFNVLAKDRGFTETHMFLLDVSDSIPATEAEQLLEEANVIVNRNMLPTDTSFQNPSGLRIGTPEMTKIGMKENDMKKIADFFKRILIDKEATQQVKKDVITFRKAFDRVHFCFDEME